MSARPYVPSTYATRPDSTLLAFPMLWVPIQGEEIAAQRQRIDQDPWCQDRFPCASR